MMNFSNLLLKTFRSSVTVVYSILLLTPLFNLNLCEEIFCFYLFYNFQLSILLDDLRFSYSEKGGKEKLFIPGVILSITLPSFSFLLIYEVFDILCNLSSQGNYFSLLILLLSFLDVTYPS